mgnify:CR=1 FL=1
MLLTGLFHTSLPRMIHVHRDHEANHKPETDIKVRKFIEPKFDYDHTASRPEASAGMPSRASGRSEAARSVTKAHHSTHVSSSEAARETDNVDPHPKRRS